MKNTNTERAAQDAHLDALYDEREAEEARMERLEQEYQIWLDDEIEREAERLGVPFLAGPLDWNEQLAQVIGNDH
jgi:hypothetical protein